MTEVKSFHGVFRQTDFEASESETVDLLAMFASFLRPRVVVEAGTYKGHLCCAIANVFRQLDHNGHIYSADVIDHGLIASLVTDPEGVKLQPYLSLWRGDYLDMLATITAPIDLAYIDASNILDSHQRAKHATLTFGRLSPGGLMFVDDTASKDWPDAQMFRQHANIYLPLHRGLTIIQAPY